MLIYGWRTKMLGTENTPTVCPSCGQHQQYLSVGQRYVHIFWIPVFPLTKSGYLTCNHCKSARTTKEFTPTERQAFSRTKGNYRTPVWLFTGAIVIALAVAWGIWEDQKAERRTSQFLREPKAGDMYIIKVKDPAEKKLPFGVLKIQSVQGEQLELRPSSWAYPSKSSVDRDLSKKKTIQPDYWTPKVVTVNKTDIVKLDVVEVVREGN